MSDMIRWAKNNSKDKRESKQYECREIDTWLFVESDSPSLRWQEVGMILKVKSVNYLVCSSVKICNQLRYAWVQSTLLIQNTKDDNYDITSLPCLHNLCNWLVSKVFGNLKWETSLLQLTSNLKTTLFRNID